MKSVILKLDTVSDGVTVSINDKVFFEPTPDKKQKDKLVNSVVMRAMDALGLGFPDITEYEVVVGLGSWTGARVGVAVIKAYYMAHPRPITALLNDGTVVATNLSAKSLQPLYDKEFCVANKTCGLV